MFIVHWLPRRGKEPNPKNSKMVALFLSTAANLTHWTSFGLVLSLALLLMAVVNATSVSTKVSSKQCENLFSNSATLLLLYPDMWCQVPLPPYLLWQGAALRLVFLSFFKVLVWSHKTYFVTHIFFLLSTVSPAILLLLKAAPLWYFQFEGLHRRPWALSLKSLQNVRNIGVVELDLRHLWSTMRSISLCNKPSGEFQALVHNVLWWSWIG